MDWTACGELPDMVVNVRLSVRTPNWQQQRLNSGAEWNSGQIIPRSCALHRTKSNFAIGCSLGEYPEQTKPIGVLELAQNLCGSALPSLRGRDDVQRD
jgi:hypothetical protein